MAGEHCGLDEAAEPGGYGGLAGPGFGGLEGGLGDHDAGGRVLDAVQSGGSHGDTSTGRPGVGMVDSLVTW